MDNRYRHQYVKLTTASRWLLASAVACVTPWSIAQSVEPASQLSSTRTVAYERDAETGAVTAEILEPTSAQHCLRKSYGRDSVGNVVSSTLQNCPGLNTVGTSLIAARTSTNSFAASGESSAGVFPNTQTNAAGHVVQLQHHNALGLPLRRQDANGLVDLFTYDSLGRKLSATRPDGNMTRWRYDYCANQAPSSGSVAVPAGLTACPQAAVLRMIEVPTDSTGVVNGASSVVYFDAQGREVQSQTLQFATVGAPRWSIVSTQYDALGRVSSKSAPYFSGDTPSNTTFTYDVLGRVTREETPSPYASGMAVRTHEYGPRRIVSTNPRGHLQTREFDEFDRTIRLTDAKGSQQSYQFTAWGNLHRTRDPLGNITQIFYDQSGNKSRMIDPGMGAWSYRYDALGQLRGQTSPAAQSVSMDYDTLGRMVRRTEPELTSNFYFDVTASNVACANVITSRGLLCEAVSSNQYRRLNQHDNLGRIVRTTTTLASTGPAYVSQIAYNSDGRIGRQIWPTGLALDNAYDRSTGALIEMKLVPDNRFIWRRLSNNARGQFTRVWYGNGVETANVFEASTGLLQTSNAGPIDAPKSLIDQAYDYNANNHLSKRTDRVHGTEEIFSYDELNRLTRSLLNNTPTAQLLRNLNYQYDSLGNITYNSEVGVYSYATGTNARPHAVQSISGQAGKTVNPVYSYDTNGNIVSVVGSNGVQRVHTWTSFDSPNSLRLSQDNVEVSFLYGPEHQRIREVSSRTVGGVTTQKTLNVLHPDNEGGLYFEREEKTVGTLNSIENRHYISAEKGAFLLITSATPIQSSPVETTLSGADLRYWHKDHLGSIVASTNASGGVLERMAYDPFGKRRAQNGAFDRTGTIDATSTSRGFTGHEHLDELDFIHMNARVYDPDIGKFLSADPTVPGFYNPQSYNRYAYTLNNPLNLVDKTGFTPSSPSSELGNNDSPKAHPNTRNAPGNNEGPDGVKTNNPDSTRNPTQTGYSGNNEAQKQGVTPSNPATSNKQAPVASKKLSVHILRALVDAVKAIIRSLETNKVKVAPNAGEAATEVGAASKVFSKEKQALVDMAKADKKAGMTAPDMQAYKDLNKKLSDPFPSNKVRGPEAHPSGAPSSQALHGHVGPVDHIPIRDPKP
jgi:RHS repeat-associated protein